MEANIKPVVVQHEIQTVIAIEKCRRMDEDDPLSKMSLNAAPPSRLEKTGSSFQHLSDDLLKQMGCRVGRNTPKGNRETLSKDERLQGKHDIRNREQTLLHPSTLPLVY